MMSRPIRRHFYLMCVLPALGPFGSAPPVSKQALLDYVIQSDGPADMVQVLLLSDDLLQREAVLAGEIDPEQADVAVLSLSRPEKEQTLPDFLMPEKNDEHDLTADRIAVDHIWERYFRYAAKLARSARSHFIETWVGYEVGLRNALALRRAEALGLDPATYLVAPELADPDMDFDAPMSEWSTVANPLDAFEALDRARWDRLTEHEPWYRFSDDEVAAYTAKLMLLHRWHRISNV